MIILGDYHTHTIYSSGKHNSKHAKGTIFENAKIAKQKGLEEIGITEHGFSHKLFGLKKENIKKIKEEIEIAQNELGIKILLGIEANIVSSNGDIDISKEERQLFDYVALGFHSFAKPKSIKEFFKFFVPNLLGFKRKKDFKRNTNALCKAIQNNNVNFITHPGVKFPIYLEEVCKVTKQNKTKLEVNGKRIAYSKQDVEILKKQKPTLIVNSDAHCPSSVGEVNFPTNFVFMNGLENLVENFKTTANFKKD